MIRNECPVCLEEVPFAVFKCGHGTCPQCLHKILKRDGRCCLCRALITGCVPPIVVGTPMAATVELERVDSDETFGITLSTDLTLVKVHPQSRAYATGMRVGQRLVEVNGLPCYSKDVVAAVLRTVGRFQIGLGPCPHTEQQNEKGTLFHRWRSVVVECLPVREPQIR